MGFVRNTSKVLAVGFVGIALLGSALNSPRTPEDRAKADQRHLGISAAGHVEQFIRARLKAPATAEFPSLWRWKTQPMGNGSFLVSSHVDAQNSFGAQIRTRFSVLVTQKNGEWTIEKYAID